MKRPAVRVPSHTSTGANRATVMTAAINVAGTNAGAIEARTDIATRNSAPVPAAQSSPVERTQPADPAGRPGATP